MNPERIPFRGRVEQNLVLHFWNLVTLTFVPRKVAVDGSISDAGFVLAIPEPADLITFVDEFRDVLRSLDTTTAGYRPRAALIAVPEEAGLEYLYHLSRHRINEQFDTYSLAAIELYHLQKQGNNIRALAAERLLPDAHVLHVFEQLRTHCRNPLYRSLQIRNLLTGDRWFDGAETLFRSYPWQFFVQETGAKPSRLPFFGDDVRRKFRGIESNFSALKGAKRMTDLQHDDELSRRVYRIIGQFVSRKTKGKTGMTRDDFQAGKGDRKKYREIWEDVCRDAFLAMRGRRDADFVEYFAGSICSVPHSMREEDFVNVTRALRSDPENVKTVAMLALSAHSYLWDPKDNNSKKSEES